MKSNQIVILLPVISFKVSAAIRTSFNFNWLLILPFLFINQGVVAGVPEKKSTRLFSMENCPFFSKETDSPLTGSESIRSNLYLVNSDNTTVLADGVLTEYNNLYHDSVYLEDAYKFTNASENLGLMRYGSVLAVERRPVILSSDTLFFKLWKTTLRNYQFEFITNNLNHLGMVAFLEDAYLGTSTELLLSGTTKINFSVNQNIASANVNRFKIIYKTTIAPDKPLQVKFLSLEANQLSNKISIDWKVENETNIKKYEVERSANGIDFDKLSTIDAYVQNSVYNSYSWTDNNFFSGNNFYRIIGIDREGSKKNSLVVKVYAGKTTTGSIHIYPNPIKGNNINLQFTNQPTGIYQVRIINNKGQVLYSNKLSINNGNTLYNLVTQNLSFGIYQLEVKTPDNIIQTQKAIVQE